MRIIIRGTEPALPEAKPGPNGLTYRQAYRLASIVRKGTQGVEVRVVRGDDEEHESSMVTRWRSPHGAITSKVSPPRALNHTQVAEEWEDTDSP